MLVAVDGLWDFSLPADDIEPLRHIDDHNNPISLSSIR